MEFLTDLATNFIQVAKGAFSGTESVTNGAFGSEAKVILNVTLFPDFLGCDSTILEMDPCEEMIFL